VTRLQGGELKQAEVGALLSNVLLLGILLISGCNGGGIEPAPVPTISPSSATLSPGQAIQLNATANGLPLTNPVWLVDGALGGTLVTGTITNQGLYTAPTGSMPIAAPQVTVRDSGGGRQSAPVPISIFEPDHFKPGTIYPSNNPLVALYSLTVPAAASVQIQFGTTTNYGLTTWEQQSPEGGGGVDIFVAGMHANTTYHMQAIVHLSNGRSVVDADHVFTTGPLPAGTLPNLAVQQTPGMAPAPGVELLCLLEGTSQTQLTAVVTDLAGNVIWYYGIEPLEPFPMKLLPNGDVLLVAAGGPAEEIDLGGNIHWQISLSDVQQGLTAAGLSFPPIQSLHHDILKLPNGHFILLVNYNQTPADQPGIGTVTGDALIDWDPHRGPLWTWSTFDHIPLSHAPNGTADWTHSNAVVYSPDDGNLILSMRNQNWIVKINYANGVGDGKILWHLGPDGDFNLLAGQAPMEWNYGQHYPVLIGPNSAGIFPLLFFNNGNNRLDANNVPCGTPGAASCYSSVPLFQLNEFANTAQVLWEHNLSPSFSSCCGSVNVPTNGDLEYDLAADGHTPNDSYIQEVTQEQNPQLVWQMAIIGQLAYRGFRIPSLYPGVEWTQTAIAAANANVTVQTAHSAH
jgi:hypothetical protein